METYQVLIDILEESVKRNGKDYVLTVRHLLNLVKMAERNIINQESGPDEGDGPEW